MLEVSAATEPNDLPHIHKSSSNYMVFHSCGHKSFYLLILC